MANKFSNPKPLNEKQKLFLREYLLSFNQTEAYRKAYPKSKNPNVNATYLMKHPAIKAAIAKAKEEAAREFKVERQRLVRELEKIAYHEDLPDIGDVADWTEDKITLIPKAQMSALARKHIKSIKPVFSKFGDRGIAIEMRQFDRIKAIELLGKTIALWRPEDDGRSGKDPSGSGPGEETGESIIARISDLARKYRRSR